MTQGSNSTGVAVGQVYVSVRSKSGREWEVTRSLHSNLWRISPLGPDVFGFGGVKALTKGTEELNNPRQWRRVR